MTPAKPRAWNLAKSVPLLAASFGAAITAFLFSLPWENEVYYKFDRNTEHLAVNDPIDNDAYTRGFYHFYSQGTKLEAWLYEPKAPATSPPPIIIMAHGLGASKDMGLHPYADQFATAGLAVLVFDYRGFGGSDGEPRHDASWQKYVADWDAAVQHVKDTSLGGRVDGKRIALWGISYSGGHVITTASKHGSDITAVVAMEPFLTPRNAFQKAIKERGLSSVLRLVAIGVHDKMRSLFGLSPAYMPLAYNRTRLAFLQLSDSDWALFDSPRPKRLGGWQNLIAGRMILAASQYAPLQVCHRVKANVMLVAGTRDAITPIEPIRECAAILGDRAVLVEYDMDHIEMHRTNQGPEHVNPIIAFYKQAFGLHTDTLAQEPAGAVREVVQEMAEQHRAQVAREGHEPDMPQADVDAVVA